MRFLLLLISFIFSLDSSAQSEKALSVKYSKYMDILLQYCYYDGANDLYVFESKESKPVMYFRLNNSANVLVYKAENKKKVINKLTCVCEVRDLLYKLSEKYAPALNKQY